VKSFRLSNSLWTVGGPYTRSLYRCAHRAGISQTIIPKIEWPDEKQFAFTIFDDPDLDTVENVSAIYPFLRDLGFRTTKAVWPVRGRSIPKIGGATCEDEQYLKRILNLKEQGFEIALHNVAYHTSTREETRHGLDVFSRLFGQYPHSMANHSGCNESIYWGNSRLSGFQKFLYNSLHLSRRNVHQGHIETSPLFWGDLCRQKVKYVRNFHYGDINTLKACPLMPYHDSARPYVNYWFAASEGPRIQSFNRMMSEENQEKLASEGGACIIYTHLANGFLEKGRINNRFRELMERMSRLNGWFVPVHTLLDFILQVRGDHVITPAERNDLERRWLWHKVFHTHGRS
jgi:hypothetical protein